MTENRDINDGGNRESKGDGPPALTPPGPPSPPPLPATPPELHIPGAAKSHLLASARLKQQCAESLAESIDGAAIEILSTLRHGRKVLVCGNGGSAADAQHFASELTGRYVRHRRALPAIALTTDASALTAISNDYGYEMAFARQVEALAKPGDIVILISTSGASASILRAAEAARQIGCKTIGLSGREGGQLAKLCDRCIIVPSQSTALIQEVHESVIHAWGTVIEGWYLDNDE